MKNGLRPKKYHFSTEAARELIREAFAHVEQLAEFPDSGSIPQELLPLRRYRKIVEKPCRVFYRVEGKRSLHRSREEGRAASTTPESHSIRHEFNMTAVVALLISKG